MPLLRFTRKTRLIIQSNKGFGVLRNIVIVVKYPIETKIITNTL